jgi:hypothetical protein
MSIIGAPRPRINPRIWFRAYIDTLVLFLPTLFIAKNYMTRLRELYGAFPRIDIDRQLGFMLLVVQCPQQDLLEFLDELQEHYEGSINRVDLSYEARPDPLMSPDDQMRFLKAHLIVKYRKAGPVLEIKNDNDPNNNGTYLFPHAHTNRATRDICMYGNRPSKLKPATKRVAKFDLRLKRRALDPDIVRPTDLIDARPDELALKQIRFVDLDMKQFRRNLFKNAMKGRTTEEARSLITHYKRSWDRREYQFGYATRIHDWYPRFNMESGEHLFELPKRLTWGAVRRSESDKAQKTQCTDDQQDQGHRVTPMPNDHMNIGHRLQQRRPTKQIEPSPRAIARAEKRERDHLDARRAMNELRLAQQSKSNRRIGR